ncbi:MAG TPA: GNAT family N-acetyltransferase [Acidimicrobiales bacterium]|nr:GNAT family N-acetyltransferase [Acidimicrobiales bacterium]
MENRAGRPVVPVVRPVGAGDVPALADMLVRSFADDPVANFMFAGDRRRRLGLRSFFTAQLRRQYVPAGHVYTTEGLGGVALWGPPDRVRHPLMELAYLLPAAPFVVSSRVHRALQLLFEVDGLHPEEPHWYLATLGTEPAQQGKGIGSALLASMLATVDEEGVPAYLESSKERNLPLYARFGFEVIDELRSKVAIPPIWRMWREPRVPDLP